MIFRRRKLSESDLHEARRILREREHSDKVYTAVRWLGSSFGMDYHAFDAEQSDASYRLAMAQLVTKIGGRVIALESKTDTPVTQASTDAEKAVA